MLLVLTNLVVILFCLCCYKISTILYEPSEGVHNYTVPPPPKPHVSMSSNAIPFPTRCATRAITVARATRAVTILPPCPAPPSRVQRRPSPRDPITHELCHHVAHQHDARKPRSVPTGIAPLAPRAVERSSRDPPPAQPRPPPTPPFCVRMPPCSSDSLVCMLGWVALGKK
jgi:hypothetical protein